MALTMYEKYGTSSVAEATDVNWKLATDPSNEYFFYPVLRPSDERDQTCSYTKYNYFRITDAGTVVDPQIVIVSPWKTDFVGYTDADGVAHISYGGSGQVFSEEGVDILNASGTKVGTGVVEEETGSIVKLNMTSTTPNMTLKTTGGVAIDVSPIPPIDKRATESRLYYRIGSAFATPSTSHDFDMIYAGIGNTNISVPLLTTGPEESYSVINSSYTGIDLYTPYIITQLRANASAWNDVGNTPQYKILFKCKIYN